jgi:hypothetical protein
MQGYKQRRPHLRAQAFFALEIAKGHLLGAGSQADFAKGLFLQIGRNHSTRLRLAQGIRRASFGTGMAWFVKRSNGLP